MDEKLSLEYGVALAYHTAQMEWIDTHAHLYSEEFKGQVPAVVTRAQEAGVSRIITLGVNEITNPQCVGFAEQFPSVYAAVGWQPQDLGMLGKATELSPDQMDTLRKQASQSKVVAIGEIGLDYFRFPRQETEELKQIKLLQRNVFRQQIELALEMGLPCCIHQRGEGTFADCLEIMKPFVGRLRAVFHCFVGNEEDAKAIFAMGCILSLTGIVTFKKAEELRETVRQLPPDKIMVETDSPYLAPEPYFRKLCEPAYVIHTGKRVASILGMQPEAFAELTTQTARNFFPRMK